MTPDFPGTSTSSDDGTNLWGNYYGFWYAFFPDTPLTLQVCTMIILMSFLKDIQSLNNQEITVLEFPLIPLGAYLVSSMFMFMFMFGNEATNTDFYDKNRYVDYSTSLTEASTFCLIGKVGYFICMIWGSFCVFHYFANLKSKIIGVVAFIFGSFLVLAIIALFLKIPYFNRFIIMIIYSAFNLVPAIDIKKVYESNNKNYLNIVTLIANFILNLSVTICYCKMMKNYGFQFLGLIVILLLIIDFALLGYYFFLYFKFGDKEITDNRKKSYKKNKEKEKEEEEEEEEEKKDLLENKIKYKENQEENVKEKDDNEEGANAYTPPAVDDSEKKEEEKIDDEKKEDNEERVY